MQSDVDESQFLSTKTVHIDYIKHDSFMQTAETKTCKTNMLFKDANIGGKTIEKNVKGVISPQIRVAVQCLPLAEEEGNEKQVQERLCITAPDQYLRCTCQ